ncbi:MAG: DUF3300 domain-containing protein, partial [Candidatus Omnitrophica bacterium]|nr:DUF3300 domain-containing protein [Candidatus Omnitrophota bacterium]
ETKIIIIEPVSPEVVYVPVYDTTIIYGNWWYPGYPPYSFYPRRYYGTWFFSGFFVGTFWETWYCNWHSRDVYININHYNNFINLHYRKGDDRHFYKDGHDNQPWRHESRDRKGPGNRDSLKVEQSRPDLPKQNQDTVRLPMNDLKPGLRPTINVSKNDLNNQPNRKKLPEKELRRRTPSSDSRAKESKEPSALVNAEVKPSSPRIRVDLRSKQENQGKAKAPSSDLRPSPNDSPLNKDDAQALTDKDRERSRDATDYHFPLNRQNLPSFKVFQGPINEVSR